MLVIIIIFRFSSLSHALEPCNPFWYSKKEKFRAAITAATMPRHLRRGFLLREGEKQKKTATTTEIKQRSYKGLDRKKPMMEGPSVLPHVRHVCPPFLTRMKKNPSLLFSALSLFQVAFPFLFLSPSLFFILRLSQRKWKAFNDIFFFFFLAGRIWSLLSATSAFSSAFFDQELVWMH